MALLKGETSVKKTKGSKASKAKAKLADLEPKKDPKGGIIAILIGLKDTKPTRRFGGEDLGD